MECYTLSVLLHSISKMPRISLYQHFEIESNILSREKPLVISLESWANDIEYVFEQNSNELVRPLLTAHTHTQSHAWKQKCAWYFCRGLLSCLSSTCSFLVHLPVPPSAIMATHPMATNLSLSVWIASFPSLVACYLEFDTKSLTKNFLTLNVVNDNLKEFLRWESMKGAGTHDFRPSF